MSGTIGKDSTFRQINETFGAKVFTKDHLRSEKDGDGTLYLHPFYRFSGSSDESLLRRKEKWEEGSKVVIEVLDREYGRGVRDLVLRNVQGQVDPPETRDITKEMMTGDLPKIMDELQGKTPFKSVLNGNQQLQKEVFGLGETQEPGNIVRDEGTEQLMRRMFGRTLTDGEIRGLGGIPDGCNVRVRETDLDPRIHLDPRPGESGLMISMSGKDPNEKFNEIKMTVYRDRSGGLHLYRDSTVCGGGQPSGIGSCALVRQVDVARSLGVTTIHNFSTGGKGYPHYNGYYTWARCGGNAPLVGDKVRIGENQPVERGKINIREDDEYLYREFLDALSDPDKALKALRAYEKREKIDLKIVDEEGFKNTILELSQKENLDVQDLMRTEDGRAFWRATGFPLPLEFDLRNNSKTMQTFRDYTVPNSCFELR